MFLVRLQPAREVVTVRDRKALEGRDRAPRLETRAIAWKPAIELENRERELILRTELPGCDRDDIEIRAARTAIAIVGERQATEQNLNRSEFRYGRFERFVRLPVSIDNTQIRAELTQGILTLTLPKVGRVSNQAVKVNLTRSTSEQLPQSDRETLEEPSRQPARKSLEESFQKPSDMTVRSVDNDETDDLWTAE